MDKAYAAISFRDLVSLVTMGELCRVMAVEMPGPWHEYFGRLASLLAKYEADVEKSTDLPLSQGEILVFHQLAQSAKALPNVGGPAAGIRISQKAVESLQTFASLFRHQQELLPWNGDGIREAVVGLGTLGREAADVGKGKLLVFYEDLTSRLVFLGEAFAVAAQEMERQIGKG